MLAIDLTLMGLLLASKKLRAELYATRLTVARNDVPNVIPTVDSGQNSVLLMTSLHEGQADKQLGNPKETGELS